jgi:hypothetical protein
MMHNLTLSRSEVQSTADAPAMRLSSDEICAVFAMGVETHEIAEDAFILCVSQMEYSCNQPSLVSSPVTRPDTWRL